MILKQEISIFPLLTYGSHIMPKVLFHQWLLFFFLSTNDPCEYIHHQEVAGKK